MPRPSLLVAATLIASPWACAQAPYLIGYDPQDPNHAPAQDTLISPSPRAWPDFLETAIHAGQSTPTSTFQRAIAGNFTGHAVADVVTLNDSIPVLITAPGLHDHCGRLLFSDPGHVVRDIAAVHGRSTPSIGNPNQDGIALVSQLGLFHWTKTGTQPYSLQRVDIAWSNVALLATSRKSSPVIFGMEATGTIRSAAWNPSFGTHGGYVTQPWSWTIDSDAIALASVDWNGDGVDEVAAVTSTGFYVHTQTGTQLYAEEITGSLHRLVAYTTMVNGNPDERIAWLREAVGGGYEVAVRGDQPSENDDVPLGSAPGQTDVFVGISAGDWNCDQHDDLFLTTSDNIEVTMLINLADGPQGVPFQYSPLCAWRIATRATNTTPFAMQSNAILGEFDGDSDLDLFVPLESYAGSLETGHIVLANRVLEDSTSVELVPPAYGTNEPNPFQASNLTTTGGTILVHFQEASQYPAATGYELLVWKMTANDGLVFDSAQRSSTPVGSQILIGTTWCYELSFDFTFPPVASTPPGGEYYVVLRPIEEEGGFVRATGVANLRHVELYLYPPGQQGPEGDPIVDVTISPPPPVEPPADPPPQSPT